MPKQIMIAEAAPLLAPLLGAALRSKGFVVLSTATAKEAAEVFHANRGIRLVLLDQDLADGQGVEALKAIRTSPRQPTVWYMTSAADACSIAELVNHGADMVLKKPLDASALVAEVVAFVDKPTVVLQAMPPEAPDDEKRRR